MANYQQLADALIRALKESTSAGLANIDIQRRNFGEDTNNKMNARGTLYSTAGGYIRSRADASKFLPAKADLRQKQIVGTIGIKSTLLDTTNKIRSMNRAAKELDKIDDKYFESLLT